MKNEMCILSLFIITVFFFVNILECVLLKRLTKKNIIKRNINSNLFVNFVKTLLYKQISKHQIFNEPAKKFYIRPNLA